jgi:hypothetical protein
MLKYDFWKKGARVKKKIKKKKEKENTHFEYYIFLEIYVRMSICCYVLAIYAVK